MTHSSPHGGSSGLDEELELLAHLLTDGNGDSAARPGIPRRDVTAPAPLSFAQELLWMLDRATPGLTAYNMHMVRRLHGALDVRALEQALSAIAARHESLRMRFVGENAEPSLCIDPPAPVSVTMIDVSAHAESEREAEAHRIVEARVRTPFDLATEHMFRAMLVRVADDDHLFVIDSHHIVADGWSFGVLSRELSDAYAAVHRGRAPAFAPLPIQFSDYASWERTELAGNRLEKLMDFWRGHLLTADTPLDLPTDHARPSTPTFMGGRAMVSLGEARTPLVKRFAQARGATLYMVLLTAYATVLHRLTGKNDVLVGSGSAGRTRPELEPLVGYLANTLVQRVDCSGDPSFSDLLDRVRISAAAVYDHQDIPLEKLVLELRHGDERVSPAPLFDVVLTMQDAFSSPLQLDDLVVEPVTVDSGATKFDITLFASERADGLALMAQYRRDLFEPATMDRFMGHLTAVIDDVIADPSHRISEISMLTFAERAQLDAWNATRCNEGPPATITELFARQVARIPDRTAVVAGDGMVTYAELAARAHHLAHSLRRAGAMPGDAIALESDRSIDAIVGILGILEIGAFYVPIPSDLPPLRREQQMRECGARIMVASDDTRSGAMLGVTVVTHAGAHAGAGTTAHGAGDTDALAYVLYTSGSTGTPKGVAVSHANVVHYVRAVSRVLADVPADNVGDGLGAFDGAHVGMVSTLAADLGNTSLYAALLSGATLHIVSKEVAADPARFADYVRVNPLDYLKITPGHLSALVGGNTGAALAPLLPRRWIILGGERLDTALAREIVAAERCRLLNHYGPTETTVGACTFEATRTSLDGALTLGARTVPIGVPLANTQVLVLDANRNELPIGAHGELWILGDGVTPGYLGRDDLTRERFVDLSAGRAYRTGDRVRRLADGTLEFLGRTDSQVKIRGYRVELGEVEHVLSAHDDVAQAFAALRGDGDSPALIAYAVLKNGRATDSTGQAGALQAWMRDRLPEHMVPSDVVVLDTLPLTANGKVDRERLPDPTASTSAAAAYVAPRSEIERQVAELWMDVLKRDRVGVTDDFLSLGGHSLLAIRLLGKISKAFGVRLPLRALFDAPTVEQVARLIASERHSGIATPAISAARREAYRVGVGDIPNRGDAGSNS